MLENNHPQQTLQYLNDVLGGAVLRVIPGKEAAQLPYFLQDFYEVVPIELLGHPITIACIKGRQPLTAHQLGQHTRQLHELLHAPVVVALPEITPGERRQLIQRGIAFVVPNRQLFAPKMGMILTERFGAELRREQEIASPATQALLIWFLNHHLITESWHPFIEAELLGYTGMTATRAIRELLQFNLFEVEQRGRAKYLRLIGNRRELWEKSKPHLRTPVFRTLWTYDQRILKVTGARWAGETALARITMLNEPQQQVVAVTSDAIQQAKLADISFEPRAVADGIPIQVWRYKPEMVDKKTVDPLSLWLSLQDSQDNRIQTALDEIEERFPW